MIESLKAEIQSTNQAIQEIMDVAQARDVERFESSGGCEVCRGRGWVVVWDTLDCVHGSYAQYAGCSEEECTPESRKRSGLKPKNDKYDRNRGTMWRVSLEPSEAKQVQALRAKVADLDRDLDREKAKWQPSPGKIVEVVAKTRSRGAPAVGVKGLVKKIHVNDWGTKKALVVDSEGNQHWPTVASLKVIDPSPDTTPWDDIEREDRRENGYPVVGVIKKNSAKALLIRTTRNQEFWVPKSQIDKVHHRVKKGETVSIMLPMWVAQRNNLVSGSSRG